MDPQKAAPAASAALRAFALEGNGDGRDLNAATAASLQHNPAAEEAQMSTTIAASLYDTNTSTAKSHDGEFQD
jgi:hypothetical protein